MSGVPLAATVLIKFAVLGVLAIAAARVGTVNAAAHSIAVSMASLMFTAAVAIGQAIIPLMAPYLKAKDVRGLRAAVRAGVKTALGAVVLLGVALAVLRVPVLSFFTHDPDVRHALLTLLPLVLLVALTDALQAVFGFGLVAIRNTVPSSARLRRLLRPAGTGRRPSSAWATSPPCGSPCSPPTPCSSSRRRASSTSAAAASPPPCPDRSDLNRKENTRTHDTGTGRHAHNSE
ncbi:hypothetical protein SBADM41S_04516 [Streptomyces badius]